jgi:hypothetical protein
VAAFVALAQRVRSDVASLANVLLAAQLCRP